MAGRPHFPLPKGYFGPVVLTKEQEERYREIVRRRLQSALAEEHEFAVVRKRQVDASKWKLYKSKDQLHTYKRRAKAAVLGDAKLGSMLCIGRIEGSLEDMVYGMYDKSHDEMKISMKYMDTTTKDCTVLHTIDLATASDPFHYLGFKWFVTRFPSGTSLLIKDRDWPYLEATGIETDSDGRRYGYLIIHAVSLPNAPAFDRSDVVRGQLFFSSLFREHEGGYIEIFSQGLFDPAGDVAKTFSAVMTHEMLVAVSKATKCAEAKKLTVLALANASAAPNAAAVAVARHRCSVCSSSGRMFSSLRVCRVCGATVCAKCRLKKFLFAGRQHAIVNVAVCPPCVLTAKTMSVRPAEAAFSILGEKHLPDELVRADTPSETTSDTPDAPTPRDSDGDGGYTMSVSSEMSEDDMEGVIEAMMKHKLHSSRGVASDQRSVLFETGEPTPHSHVPRYEPGAPGLPSEFEFRNLHQPQYSQHQPHYAYAQPQQPLHPADPQFVPTSEFVGLNQQQYYEYQSTLPPRPGGADFRSPNEYQRHPGAEGAPHVQYASSRGPGAVPLSAQQMPPMAPMPSTALEYHYTQGVSQQQAAMGPQPAGMAPHQAELFHKMVALQNSAQHVYQITKANEEYMRNLHGPERN